LRLCRVKRRQFFEAEEVFQKLFKINQEKVERNFNSLSDEAEDYTLVAQALFGQEKINEATAQQESAVKQYEKIDNDFPKRDQTRTKLGYARDKLQELKKAGELQAGSFQQVALTGHLFANDSRDRVLKEFPSRSYPVRLTRDNSYLIELDGVPDQADGRKKFYHLRLEHDNGKDAVSSQAIPLARTE
jgi:tetratricopeptide (TPR) repeat protein